MLRVCGIAVLCLVCVLAVGRTSPTAAVGLRIGGGLLIFGVIAVMLKDSIDLLRGMTALVHEKGQTVTEALGLMLKALGIAFISKICADVCRDCGEGMLAGGVESAGRIAIISMCIPVVSEILTYATDLLGRV